MSCYSFFRPSNHVSIVLLYVTFFNMKQRFISLKTMSSGYRERRESNDKYGYHLYD